MQEKKNIPTLKGFLVGNQISVWCPYCRHFHLHGFVESHPAVKHHRVAHCCDKANSPFKETGYYIQSFSKRELKEIGIEVINASQD